MTSNKAPTKSEKVEGGGRMKTDQTTARTEESGRSKKKYETPQIVTYGNILEVTHAGNMVSGVSDSLPPPGQHKS
jgi:hypothetical protein